MLLKHWCLILGAPLLLSGIVLLLARDPSARAARGFARSVWAGRVLSALAWIWAGWALRTMPLELLMPLHRWIPLLTAAAIPLTWIWMPELLSCRAVGGLLVLFPCPLLLATRVPGLPVWRLVPVTFAYVCIVTGMILILYPYYLRRWIDWTVAARIRVAFVGALSLLMGAVFIAAAFKL